MEKNPIHIALLQKIYAFCEKYHFSHDVADAHFILRNGLRNMALENKMSWIINDDAAEKHYVNVTVYFLNEYMIHGPFTPEQLKDLADIGIEIKFESE